MNYQDIAKKIIGLRNADFELRGKLVKEGKLVEGYNQEMQDLHNRNAAILNEIIDVIAYPTIEKVGKEANEAVWLVIQHAIGKPSFMKKCVKLLNEAVDNIQADPQNLAYLCDRIATFEGRPQLYGSQFDWDENGKLNPHPFDDLVKVNARRKSIGLNSLEEQITIIRQQSKNENHSPPKDFKKRKQAMDQWRRKVGWIK